MQLPPKRYHDDKDPMFDSIRHQPWFVALEKRREKLPGLKQAQVLIEIDGLNQIQACEVMGVDERELRDYLDFVHKNSKFAQLDEYSKVKYQTILNESYDSYKFLGASIAFPKIIHNYSRAFGMDGRPVVELWDVDATFYPTNYKGIKP